MEYKKCPFCNEDIPKPSTQCRYCGKTFKTLPNALSPFIPFLYYAGLIVAACQAFFTIGYKPHFGKYKILYDTINLLPETTYDCIYYVINILFLCALTLGMKPLQKPLTKLLEAAISLNILFLSLTFMEIEGSFDKTAMIFSFVVIISDLVIYTILGIKLIKNNAEITGLLGIAILLQIPILFFGIGLEDGFSFYNLFVAILSFGIDYFYLTQLYNLLKE